MYTPSPTRYDTMKYRSCGRSGLRLPEISIGLWHNFGGVDPFETSRAMVRRAFDLGVTHFDLANNYGPPPGSSEEVFGEILRKDFIRLRDEITVATKAGYLMWPGPYGEWGSRKHLLSSLDQSLKRMGLEYVDIFYHHRPDPQTPLEESMGALDHAVKSGKALYVGISSYNTESTREAAAILKDLGTPCIIHQPKYNMLNRWIENDLLSTLKDGGIGCIPFSPLAQGLLTDRYLHGIPEDSRAAKEHGFLKKESITGDLMRIVRRLTAIAEKRGQSLAQMSVAWVLRFPEVTSVLIGASSVAQIDDNLAALQNTAFSDEELEEIDFVLRGDVDED